MCRLQCFQSLQLGTSIFLYLNFSADFSKESYYHDFCLINYNDVNSIKTCWEGDNTVSLPDLRTEDSDVLSVWESWITQLVSKYSIDGLRVDSAQQVDNAFFPPFQSAGMLLYSSVRAIC